MQDDTDAHDVGQILRQVHQVKMIVHINTSYINDVKRQLDQLAKEDDGLNSLGGARGDHDEAGNFNPVLPQQINPSLYDRLINWLDKDIKESDAIDYDHVEEPMSLQVARNKSLI